MKPQSKQVIPFLAVSTASTATTAGNIDRLGYNYMSLDVELTTASATTAPIALKLSESDDTVVTNFADITKFVGGGTGGFTMPAGPATENTWGVKFNVDLRARKRYLKLSVTPGTTVIVSAVANLFKEELAPVDATKANVKALVQG